MGVYLWGSDPANALLFQDILFIFGVFGVLECTFGGQKQQFKVRLCQKLGVRLGLLVFLGGKVWGFSLTRDWGIVRF